MNISLRELDIKVKEYILDIYDIFKNGYSKNLFTSKLESGLINAETGETVVHEGALRTADFIPVIPNTTYYFENSNNYEMHPRYYDENKRFSRSVFELFGKGTLTVPVGCYYIKFNTHPAKYENKLDTKFLMFEGTRNPNSIDIGEQLQFILESYHKFGITYIDNDPNLAKLSLERPRGSSQHHTVFEIKAPDDDPRESTLTLMRHPLTGGAEFIDITDMDYGEGRKVCIVIQKRGTTAKLSSFDVSFNEGLGIVDKFKVHSNAKVVECKENGLTVDNEYVNTCTKIDILPEYFRNGWATDIGYQNPTIAKNGNIITVSCRILNTAPTSNPVVIQVPPVFRPLQRTNVPCAVKVDDKVGSCDINLDGTVHLWCGDILANKPISVYFSYMI